MLRCGGVLILHAPARPPPPPHTHFLVSFMLPEDPDLSDVREWHARFLFRKLEEFNVDFSLPVPTLAPANQLAV
jgi:hypothetical protein